MEFLISALVGLATIELYAWLPTFSTWLLRIAVKQLPDQDKERCLEEWSAALEALPNTLAKVCHATSLLYAARIISYDTQIEECRSAFAKAVATNETTEQTLLRLQDAIDEFNSLHQEVCAELDNEAISELNRIRDSMLHGLDVRAAKLARHNVVFRSAMTSFEKFTLTRGSLFHPFFGLYHLRLTSKDLHTCKELSTALADDKSWKNLACGYVAKLRVHAQNLAKKD